MMNFEEALVALKDGGRLTRREWDDPNEFVFIRPGRDVTGVDSGSPMGGNFRSMSHFCRRELGDICVVGWLPTAEDLLSNDWLQV